MPRYLQIGKGSLSQLPEIIKILGSIKSPLIVTDKQMVQFGYVKKLQEVLSNDLSVASGTNIKVIIHELSAIQLTPPFNLPGHCIDNTDIEISTYNYDANLLSNGIDKNNRAQETLHSHLFQSNCPMTGQPDWASILINYQGFKIKHNQLLAYLVSFREHAEFHKQCVERVFVDIKKKCNPENLTIYARYTRRGGLDINPFRSDFERTPENIRLLRQ